MGLYTLLVCRKLTSWDTPDDAPGVQLVQHFLTKFFYIKLSKCSVPVNFSLGLTGSWGWMVHLSVGFPRFSEFTLLSLIQIVRIFDRPDRTDHPSRLKNVQMIGTIIWECYPDDRKQSGSLQNLHNCPDCLDRTQFYSSDWGRLSRLGRLRSSGQRVWIVWTFFWDDRDDPDGHMDTRLLVTEMCV